LLAEFLDVFLAGYAEARDVPGRRTTSRLSPHLAHGEISPRTIWYRAGDRHAGAHASDAEKFRKELAWREFSYHLLFHNRDLAARNFNLRFDSFPWQQADTRLAAWRSGRTGYPIVDAGMRELWQTGWMHNRVRMICASFLVKHLMIDWRVGENWFADTLVDADPANNPASWQWVAGSGADAAPYFRIFNPILQGEKFDPQGIYVRRFVPELARLPDAYIHRPWEAPREALAKAGVALGPTYPEPVVDHQQARDRALDAFESLGSAD
jgi:deoxyribodipyrimidine photo-lyase